MNRVKWSFMLGLSAIFATHAYADVTITVDTVAGGVGGTVVVNYDYSALDADDAAGFQFDIAYDNTALTPTVFSDCGVNAPATHSASCTEPNGPDGGLLRVIISDLALPFDEISPFSIPDFGNFTFQLDQQGVFPLTVQNASALDTGLGNVAFVGNNGQITASLVGPGYDSVPAPGASINYGAAVVGQTTPSQTVTISEIGTDPLDVSAAVFSDTDIAFNPAFAAFSIVDGGASVDLDSECTPSARGASAGTLTITNNSVNVTPTAVYDTTCDGLSPNVNVAPGFDNINGTQGGPNPTSTFTITNPQDGFTSTATTVAAADDGNSADISLSIAPAGTVAPDGNTTFTAECDANTANLDVLLTETFTVTWDDPVGPGSAQVTVNCTIASTAPEFESTPAGGATLAFGGIVVGTGSAGQTVTISNSGDAQLDITACTVSGANAAEFNTTGCAPFNLGPAPSGTQDITVTCDPTTVGALTASLDLTTNDADEGSVSYPLTCQGLTDVALTSTPPPGGGLNIGPFIPPGTEQGTITFNNGATIDDLTMDCTYNNPDGNIAIVSPVDLDSAQQIIGPGGSLDAVFECRLDAPANASATLSCNTNDPNNTSVVYNINCSAIIPDFAIPTMSQWSLILMGLLMLLGGGLAFARRPQ